MHITVPLENLTPMSVLTVFTSNTALQIHLSQSLTHSMYSINISSKLIKWFSDHSELKEANCGRNQPLNTHTVQHYSDNVEGQKTIKKWTEELRNYWSLETNRLNNH